MNTQKKQISAVSNESKRNTHKSIGMSNIPQLPSTDNTKGFVDLMMYGSAKPDKKHSVPGYQDIQKGPNAYYSQRTDGVSSSHRSNPHHLASNLIYNGGPNHNTSLYSQISLKESSPVK